MHFRADFAGEVLHDFHANKIIHANRVTNTRNDNTGDSSKPILKLLFEALLSQQTTLTQIPHNKLLKVTEKSKLSFQQLTKKKQEKEKGVCLALERLHNMFLAVIHRNSQGHLAYSKMWQQRRIALCRGLKGLSALCCLWRD
jgi:hypothetical protein